MANDTIVISSTAHSVYKNGSGNTNLDLPIPDGVLNLYWFGDNGFIDYIGVDERSPITEMPQWALDCVAKYESLIPPPPPAPDPVKVCAIRAAAILTRTDWTQISDCPLKNKEEFSAYRAIIRNYALNPVADPVFPDAPKEQW
jgi:hypothetical protein